MTKIIEKSQFDFIERNIFQCYCGEYSYLNIEKDLDDDYIYITITKYSTSFLGRIDLAFKALLGIEFNSSNSVMISKKDIKSLIDSLKSIKKV